MRSMARIIAVFLMISGWCIGATLDERPAEPGEWGYRPEEGTIAATNPPSFSWRPPAANGWTACPLPDRSRLEKILPKPIKIVIIPPVCQDGGRTFVQA